MSHSQQAESPAQADPSDNDRFDVNVEVPAARKFVGPVRGLAVALAAQCGLTVDEIDDLQMAVDEACSLLLPHARAPQPWLRVRFRLSDGRIDAEATVPVPPASNPQVDRGGLPWTVLSALADELTIEERDGGLTIWLAKQRRPSQP